MKGILLIANIFDAIARNAIDPFQILGQLSLVAQTHFAANNHSVRRREGFGGHTGFRFFGKKGVQNSVRNSVAYLVRMPFGDGLRGKDVALAGHERCSIKGQPHARKPLCGKSVRLRLRWALKGVNPSRGVAQKG